MIELRYNKDGKLEYRTSRTTPNKPSQEAVDKLRSIIGSNADISVLVYPDSITHWNEWTIVPSEQTNSYTSGVTWVHREAVDALEQELEEVKRERDELRTKLERTVIQRTTNANLHSVIRERDQEIGSLKARVAELEAAEHDSQRYEYISKEGLIDTMTWAGCTDEEISKNMIYFVPMFLDKLHKTFISVEEYERRKK